MNSQSGGEFCFAPSVRLVGALARRYHRPRLGPRTAKRRRLAVVVATLLGCSALVGLSAKLPPEAQVYSGALDGSAGVALDAVFFASASDEDSVIRIYRRDQGGRPVREIDLSAFLQLAPPAKETDIEAATRVGDRMYWITSHGRNKNGKERPERQRFFATDIRTNATGFELTPVGKPCTNLLTELLAAPELQPFGLAAAAARPPKSPGGLSIEGLAATADQHLLIGFRNPIPHGRALIVPLLNPAAVIQGQPARFGAPLQLDLGGLGIRDLVAWKDEFIISAGPPGGGGKFKLFRWSGGHSSPQPIQGAVLKNLNPEAVIVYPDLGLREFQLLSDDSTEPAGSAKTPSVPAKAKHFRSVWIKP